MRKWDFEDADGTTSSVVFDENLLPISWMAPRLSIAARSEERNTPLDPSDALHAVIIDAEESVHRIDLTPTDLGRVFRRGETFTGETYRGGREALRAMPGDWAEVVEAAREPGEAQPQRLANAVALSMMHAALALLEATGELPPAAGDPDGDDPGDVEDGNGVEDGTGVEDGQPTDRVPSAGEGPGGDESSSDGSEVDEGALAAVGGGVLAAGGAGRVFPTQPLPGSKIMGPLIETMCKNMMLNLGAEHLFGPKPPKDPRVPTVDLLLCQGATSGGVVCHYAYFMADDIMGCLDFCKTDLSCYQNICMPVKLGVQDAIASR